MSTYIVKYSDLVSDDNRCPLLRAIQKPQMFKTVIRAQALDRHKLLYNTMVDAETKINLLIDKINSLPEGTFFSVGTLAKSANKKIAISLGKEISRRCVPDGAYRFVSAYPGKWIYQRTNKHLEEVKDFNVDLIDILKSPTIKGNDIKPHTTNTASHLRIDFTASLANILRHAYGVKYFPSRAILSDPLNLPEGEYKINLGWRPQYPEGPFISRITSDMNPFDICVVVAKVFDEQYGIKNLLMTYSNCSVLVRPEFLDEEMLLKKFDDNGNVNGEIVSTPFLEGVVVDVANKVIQVSLAT